MEVCPYCKKPFKRLKSHLPYCKMIGPTIPADQKACQSKPCAKKMKGMTKDFIKAKEREFGSEIEKRNSKLMRDKPEWTLKPFPPRDVALARAADTDSENQIQLSLEMLKNTESKITFQEKTKARFYASEGTISERKCAKDLLKSRGRRRNPSEMEASVLLGLMESSPSNQDRKYSLALSNDGKTTSANLKLDRVHPPRRKCIVKLPDVPLSEDQSSSTDFNYGSQRARKSFSSNERDSKPRDLLAVFSDVRDPETQEKNLEPQTLNLRIGTLDTIQAKETREKGRKACGSHGHAEKRVSETELRERASANTWESHSKVNLRASDAPAETTPRDGAPSLNSCTPGEAPYNESLSVSQPCSRRLVSLAIQYFQDEKADTCTQTRIPDKRALMENVEQSSPEPQSDGGPQASHPGCQQFLYPIQPLKSKSPFTNQVAVTDRTTLPSSLGLEWIPELYPAYLGLGVLPEKTWYWNMLAQKPQSISPHRERLSQVPLLEGSWTALRSVEPPTSLTSSSFTLRRLLGTIQKGWVRCSTTMKGGVGGITMLFTGYFVLCCNWSFRHLKLPPWRR